MLRTVICCILIKVNAVLTNRDVRTSITWGSSSVFEVRNLREGSVPSLNVAWLRVGFGIGERLYADRAHAN